jgi:hypothetical protein
MAPLHSIHDLLGTRQRSHSEVAGSTIGLGSFMQFFEMSFDANYNTFLKYGRYANP